MAETVRKVCNICRFCLSQNEEHLVPLAIIIDDTFTIQDVEQFTGVQDLESGNTTYMVCNYCDDILSKYVVFRHTCIKNDALFKELAAEHSQEVSDSVSQGILCVKEAVIPYEENSPDNQNAIRIEDAMMSIPTENYFSSEDAMPSSEAASEEELDTSVAIAQQSSECLNKRPKQLCPTCGIMVSDLKGHIRSHTKETPYTCSHCGIKMTNSTNLLRHVQGVHLKKIIKSCETCNLDFISYFSYNYHMKSKHGVGKSYDCQICSKKFYHKGSLDVHIIRVHSNERKFKCLTCGTFWKTKQAMKNHMRAHSSEQPYACSVCPKRFKTRYGRKSHEVAHTGVQFECKFCDKVYRYKTLLNAHVRKLHPDELSVQTSS